MTSAKPCSGKFLAIPLQNHVLFGHATPPQHTATAGGSVVVAATAAQALLPLHWLRRRRQPRALSPRLGPDGRRLPCGQQSSGMQLHHGTLVCCAHV